GSAHPHAEQLSEAGERRFRDSLESARGELSCTVLPQDHRQVDEGPGATKACDLPRLRQSVKVFHVVREVERWDMDVEDANVVFRAIAERVYVARRDRCRLSLPQRPPIAGVLHLQRSREHMPLLLLVGVKMGWGARGIGRKRDLELDPLAARL